MKLSIAQALRIGRRLILVLAVVVAALIVRRYDFERLDERVRAFDGLMRPSAFLILAEVTDGTVLGEGSFVEARIEVSEDLAAELGKREWLIMSRIAAMPGQRVELQPTKPSEYEILVDGRHTWATVTEAQLSSQGARRLVTGLVPEGSVVLIDPSLDAGGSDSRDLGFVPCSRLTRKILSYY